MFSATELAMIKSWANSGKEILTGHLNSNFYTHKEKEEKRAEYAVLESIIAEATELQTEYESVDADQLVHYMEVLNQYHEWVNEQLQKANMSAEDCAAEKYVLGFVQAHLELGLLSAGDIEILDEWDNIVG